MIRKYTLNHFMHSSARAQLTRMSAQVTSGHLVGMTVSVIQSAPCWGALTSMVRPRWPRSPSLSPGAPYHRAPRM